MNDLKKIFIFLLFIFLPQTAVARDPFYKTPTNKSDLEKYRFKDLHYIGYFASQGIQWAFIQDPKGKVHRITRGRQLADQYEVTKFDASRLWVKNLNAQQFHINMTTYH